VVEQNPSCYWGRQEILLLLWNAKILYTEDYCHLGCDAIFIGRTCSSLFLFTPPVRYVRSVLILPSRLDLGLKVVRFQHNLWLKCMPFSSSAWVLHVPCASFPNYGSRRDVIVLAFLLLTLSCDQAFSSVPCSEILRLGERAQVTLPCKTTGNIILYVGFEVFTAVTMKNAVLWGMTFFARGFFYPEDGGDTILRNVGSIDRIYTAPYPRRRHSS
jgi:hypothetical protein